MNIKVEVIKQNDTQIMNRIMEIEKQAFGNAGLDEWNLVPYMRHGRVMVLKYHDKIVGDAQFVRDWDNPKRIYLYGIAIDYRYRGKGLGTRFLSECLFMIKEDGAEVVELTVDPKNDAAVKVYQSKLGFDIVADRKDEYGPGENRLVMERKL